MRSLASRLLPSCANSCTETSLRRRAPLAGRGKFHRRGLIRVVAAPGVVRLCGEPRCISGELSIVVAKEANHWVTQNSSPEWSSPPRSRPTVVITDPASIHGMEHPTQITFIFHARSASQELGLGLRITDDHLRWGARSRSRSPPCSDLAEGRDESGAVN